jgi:hypothetical protein
MTARTLLRVKRRRDEDAAEALLVLQPNKRKCSDVAATGSSEAQGKMGAD